MQQHEEFLERDDFVVWMPNAARLTKSETGERRIGGLASTEARDRQNEVIVQKGLDFSEFVNAGYFNDNHKQDTDAIVGIPETVKYIAGKGWYTEGYLLKSWPLADRIWQLAKALAGTKRRLGFSVEGKVVERGDRNRITRAIIRNVAVTNRPVNTQCTWDVLSKAFARNEEIEECFNEYGKRCACKSLNAGSQRPKLAGGAAVSKNDSESEEEEIKNNTFKLYRAKKSVDDAVVFLRKIRPQYSESTCRKIVEYTLNMKEVA